MITPRNRPADDNHTYYLLTYYHRQAELVALRGAVMPMVLRYESAGFGKLNRRDS